MGVQELVKGSFEHWCCCCCWSGVPRPFLVLLHSLEMEVLGSHIELSSSSVAGAAASMLPLPLLSGEAFLA